METRTYKKDGFKYEICIANDDGFWFALMDSEHGDKVCKPAESREGLEQNLIKEGYKLQ